MTVAVARRLGTEVRVPDHPGAPIRLRGEFDAHELASLREAVDGRPGWERTVRVDLSGVTFLDARCTRELLLRSLPHGPGVVLCNPSIQAERSLLACGSSLPGGRAFKIKNMEDGGS